MISNRCTHEKRGKKLAREKSAEVKCLLRGLTKRSIDGKEREGRRKMTRKINGANLKKEGSAEVPGTADEFVGRLCPPGAKGEKETGLGGTASESP